LIEKFKQATTGAKAATYFSTTNQADQSHLFSGSYQIELPELISSSGGSHLQVARNLKVQAQTGGLQGPVELVCPTQTAIYFSLLNQVLLTPTRVGEWLVIVRLEANRAQLDERMQAQLLNSLLKPGFLSRSIKAGYRRSSPGHQCCFMTYAQSYQTFWLRRRPLTTVICGWGPIVRSSLCATAWVKRFWCEKPCPPIYSSLYEERVSSVYPPCKHPL